MKKTSNHKPNKPAPGKFRVALHSHADFALMAPPQSANVTFVKRGSTAHFVVSYDQSLGVNGPALADAVLAACERDYNQLQAWFGNITIKNLPFNIFIRQGTTGAVHSTCFDVDLFCDAFNGTDGPLIAFEVVMEEDEVFIANQNAGWACGSSNGEGLSRVLATEIYPNELTPVGLNVTWATAARWLDNIPNNPKDSPHPPRPDFITTNPATDQPGQEVGCASLFINWLRFQLGFDLGQIVGAGGTTLAQTFTTLTGGADGFSQFSALLAVRYPVGMASGLLDDNPFPIGRQVNGIVLVERFFIDNAIPPIPQESGPIWVIFGQAKFKVPDAATLSRLFPNAPINQLYGLGAIGYIPIDGTLLREESSSDVWLVLLGTRRIAPPGTPGQVYLLWDGALLQIPILLGIVSGHVTDVQGKPIADAMVLLKSTSGNTLQLSTDSSGFYSTPPLSPGIYDISAGQSGLQTSEVTLTVPAGVAVTTQDFVLTRTMPCTITGFVTDSGGTPIVGASVRWEQLPGILDTQTNSAGFYSIGLANVLQVTPGPCSITVRAAGFVVNTVNTSIPNGASFTQNFVLVNEGALAGVVTDAQGTPIPGATVTVGSGSAFTDSSGSFSVTLDPGTYTVTVRAPGFASGKANVIVTSDATTIQNFTLVQTVSGTIVGNVTDDTGGNPINNATVGVGYTSARTNGGGDYSLSNVIPGPTVVTAGARGFLSQKQTVQVIAGQTITIDFDLTKQSRFPQ
jgi:hypothetical protein